MKYKLLILLLFLNLTFSNFAGLFQLGGELAGILGEVAFSSLTDKAGDILGKLTQKQIDELTAKHILMWPPGATAAEIEELKKQGYHLQLSWSVPGTPYAYSPTGWIQYWRAEKSMKLPPAEVSTVSKGYFGDFLNIKIDQPMTPIEAAEKLRTEYARGVISSGTKMYLIYSSCIEHTCSDKEKDDQTLRALWLNIKQLRPVVAWLRTIAMKDPKIAKAYALVFDLDNLIKSPNNSPYNAAINIQKFYSSNRQNIYNMFWGPPPKIS